MRAIEIVMLCVQAAMLVVVAVTILMARTPAGARRPRPYWSSLAISCIVAGGASFQITDHHQSDAAARLLEYGSGLLLGMGLMSMLLELRRRLGRDSVPA